MFLSSYCQSQREESVADSYLYCLLSLQLLCKSGAEDKAHLFLVHYNLSQQSRTGSCLCFMPQSERCRGACWEKSEAISWMCERQLGINMGFTPLNMVLTSAGARLLQSLYVCRQMFSRAPCSITKLWNVSRRTPILCVDDGDNRVLKGKNHRILIFSCLARSLKSN